MEAPGSGQIVILGLATEPECLDDGRAPSPSPESDVVISQPLFG